MLLCASLLFALPAQAHGDEAQAEAALARGQAALERQDYRAAVSAFEDARALAPDKPGPLLYLGLAHASIGECNEAVPILTEYLRRKASAPRPPDAPATSEANPAALRALQVCTAQVEAGKRPPRLRVDTEPSGADVRLDDASAPPLGRTPLDTTAVPAGHHRLRLAREGYANVDKEVDLSPGVETLVQVPLAPLASPAPPTRVSVEAPSPPPPPPPPRNHRLALALGLAGGAVIVGTALGVGLGLGLASSPPASDYPAQTASWR